MKILSVFGIALALSVGVVVFQNAPAETETTSADPLVTRPEVRAFIQEMSVKHGLDADALSTLFEQAHSQSSIIELMKRPAEGKPWHVYRKIFLTPERIAGGVDFWRDHQNALSKAEQLYGVPAEIIVAIIGVETRYGGNTGGHKVLEALSTLAFDFPERAAFFRKELENYLLLTREEGINPLSLQGSYAGAMGLAQFMPSSYRAYAVDFDGDGQRDLWNNTYDAIGSVANYLAKHRWQPGAPIATSAQVSGDQYLALISTKIGKPGSSVAALRRHGVNPQGAFDEKTLAMLLQLKGQNGLEYWLGFYNFYVITRYNRSPLYAMAVYQLSQEIHQQYQA